MHHFVSLALAAAVFAGSAALAAGEAADGASVSPPPRGARLDYQLGADYRLPSGTRVVVRDWFAGRAPKHVYAICYVNAFQTQPDEPGVERPDERSAWPQQLVLGELEDPGWPGELLIDISGAAARTAALNHVAPMIRACARKGFEAVEFDNLDSWTRFRGTPKHTLVPFGRTDAVAYAEALTKVAHDNGLAVGRKNTPQLGRKASRDVIGFDFAIAEECARYQECGRYRRVFGKRVLMIEYRSSDLRQACRWHGSAVSIVRRDRALRTPDRSGYRFARCPSR
jgi:hypothetical protein